MPPKAVQKKNSGNIECPSEISKRGGSFIAGLGKKKKPKAQEQRKEFTWPKWCDTTINNEKWDGGSAKKPEKGKSPSPAIFDDPEGQPALPESLAAKCKSWKRIPDLFANGGGTCVFEEAPGLPPSIVQTNANLTFSPFIRHLLSSIRTVQEFTHESEGLEEFRPGYLIWSLNKSGKEHKPLVNNNGKYAVKLFFMGQFRKIIIDDNIPCDEEGIPLLPMSHNIAEIWPLILSKALLKVCSFGLSPRSPEIPEFHVVTALTGWLPEVLNGSCTKTWELLQGYLSEELFEQASPEEEPVAKDKNAKKDKNKKSDKPAAPPARVGTFCLAEIESPEAPIHPCQIVKVRDRPLRPPSPDPEIPAWKLIRPQQDVLEMLAEIEKKQIPNRWCKIRSPFKTEGQEAEEVEQAPSECASVCQSLSTVVNPNDWMRIEDITNDENARIYLFHIPKSSELKVTSLEKETNFDEFFVDENHESFFYADMPEEVEDIIVSFQVLNSKLPPKNESSSSDLNDNEESTDVSVVVPDALFKHKEHIEASVLSSLTIQTFDPRKYVQNYENILVNETFSQGSVRFRLPRGRTLLRFKIKAKFMSAVSIIHNADRYDCGQHVVYGTYSELLTAASADVPFLWQNYAKSILQATQAVTTSFGDGENYVKYVRRLKKLVGNDKLWEAYRLAFYKFSSSVLKDQAKMEDLGALRMLFRDFHPNPGPAEFFIDLVPPIPTVPADDIPKSGGKKGAKKQKFSNPFTQVTTSVKAATTLIKTWRGHIARMNFDAIMGQSPGAKRRQESALNRFKIFFEKLDETSAMSLVYFFIEEAREIGEEIKQLSGDMPKTFKTVSFAGKYAAFEGGKAVFFRNSFTIEKPTEVYPIFTELEAGAKHATNIRLLDEQGHHIGKILRRVRPVTLNPGRYTIIGDVSAPSEETFDFPANASWRLQMVYDFNRTIIMPEKDFKTSLTTNTGAFLPPSSSVFEPGLLFRYHMGVPANTPVSFFVKTSCETAKMKLMIKDNGREVFCTYGTGEIFIPSWNYKMNSVIENGLGSISRTASRTSNKGGKKSTTSVSDSPVDESENAKLTIEVHSSKGWTLTDEQKEAVKILRKKYSNSIKVHENLVQKTSSKSVTNVDELPENCAQWKLMMFVDSDKADSVELKLDTSRIDKIKAMKLAWEAADSGRYERAVATREKYLESVGGKPPKLKDLLAKIPKASIEKSAEESVRDYENERERLDKFLAEDEERRQQLLEQYTEDYEKLEEEEEAILEAIHHSLQPARLEATV